MDPKKSRPVPFEANEHMVFIAEQCAHLADASVQVTRMAQQLAPEHTKEDEG